jgi:PPOX class probable F420-dependent enzyme
VNAEERVFLDEHTYAVLATTLRDGSPQQSMVGYAVDADGRIVISTKAFTAKWHNLVRDPRASLTVADGREHVVVTGPVELISDDPERAELTADVFAVLTGAERPDPSSIIPFLDDEDRTVLRIAPETSHLHR